jgi:hypothetical protein
LTDPHPLHTDRVIALSARVQADRDSMIRLGISVFGTAGSPMYPLDLMAFGAMKRCVSTASAFRMMIESWNMVCARSLLRIHIDTSLRFSAAWLVEEPHDFATRVLKGERIDKMKDQAGKRLSDAHLVEVHAPEYPWLPAVYKGLSGYVHFSGSHIYDSIANVADQDRTVSFEIGDADLKFPEFSWIEVLDCFREATRILAKYLLGYAHTKRLSPAELEEAKRQFSPSAAGPEKKP